MSRETDIPMCSHREELFIGLENASSFLAHLRAPGGEQFLRNHLLKVSAITSRLAAKIGMPLVGELIALHTISAITPLTFRITSTRLLVMPPWRWSQTCH